MDSKFFNGFLVLLFPDRIFKKVIKSGTVYNPFISLFFSCLVFTALWIYFFKMLKFPAIHIQLNVILGMIPVMYFALIIFSAVLSSFFNWIYILTIKVGGNPVISDFYANFLCHLYIVPFWIFIYLWLTAINCDVVGVMVSIFLIIRLLDMEARLIKIVYNLRLIQAHAIILIELILILAGMGLAYFAISYLDIFRH